MKASACREEIAWAAGLFEGEGTIVPTAKAAVRLALSMNDRDVVERFCEIAAAGTVRQKSHQSWQWRTQWVWAVDQRDDVQRILRMFLPWLHSRRREKAEAMLERLAKNLSRGAARTRCKRGHRLAGENVYLTRNGHRQCRACAQARERRRVRIRNGQIYPVHAR